MSAKWSISNLPALAAICLLMLWCGPLSAQERDTVIIVKHDTVYLQHKPDTVVTGRVRHSRYDRRVHRYRKRWEALIPTHTKIQFAGNMGLLSRWVRAGITASATNGKRMFFWVSCPNISPTAPN